MDTKAKTYYCHYCSSLVNITNGVCTNKSCITNPIKKRYWKINSVVIRSKDPITFKEAKIKLMNKYASIHNEENKNQ